MQKKILVVGSNGQLGTSIQYILQVEKRLSDGLFAFVDYPDFDLNQTENLDDFFVKNQFDFIVNCAAYTAVDKAESERDLAFSINQMGAGYLARIAKKQKAKFIHISTDYVFDGTSKIPYKETDKTNPINVYGESKLAGEIAVLENNPNAIILRTSWLYSPFGANFVKSMLNLFEKKTELGIVNDQMGCPTSALDLSRAIFAILDNHVGKSGLYHFSNQQETSWFGFAKQIAEKVNSDVLLRRISTSEYPTPAKRPQYSVMDCSQFSANFGFTIRPWQAALDEVLSTIASSHVHRK